MTLPASGAISFNAINVELGVAGTTNANINQASYRTLAGVASGTISLSNFYGKSNRVTANITISANTANYTLNTAKVTGYVAGATDVTLTINSGVYVYSGSTGTAALIVNTSWTAGDTVKIINNGTIVGRGGDGGQGFWGTGGGGGGLGLLVQRATTITNNNRIAGGGGGGGSGGAVSTPCIGTAYGGDGGGGIGNGSPGGSLTGAGGGSGGSSIGGECDSSEQTYTYGGTSGSGGGGGSYGSSGASGDSGSAISTPPCCNTSAAGGTGGGAGGGSVSGNSNITWLAFGTRNGGIA